MNFIYFKILFKAISECNSHVQGELNGKVLIITSKPSLDEFGEIVRSGKGKFKELGLHMYTSSISERRKLGAIKLANFDFVVTTFDVLFSYINFIKFNYII